MITRDTSDVYLPGLGKAARLAGCPELPSVLQSALAGWPLTVADPAGPEPAVVLRGGDNEWRLVSPSVPQGITHGSRVAAVCGAVADFIECFLEEHRQWVGLHCASVEINGRLVLFPETHRAGKSTLTAALAGGGVRVFGDDVLVLDENGQGMALGVAPRLRLPLPQPPAVDVALHNYTAAHAGPEDGRYCYLNLPEGQLARHGETLPLGAVVLSERDDRLDEPELVPLAPGEGLSQLLRQHFAHDLSSDVLMQRFLPLMRSLPCRLLRYPEPLAAARCLIAKLPGVIDGLDREPVPPRGEPTARADGATVAADDRWRAVTAVREYSLDADRFLIHVPSGAIHRLNATGQLVWGLLKSEPMSAREVTELLAEHFDDVPDEQIDADVRSLLADLNAAELIERA